MRADPQSICHFAFRYLLHTKISYSIQSLVTQKFFGPQSPSRQFFPAEVAAPKNVLLLISAILVIAVCYVQASDPELTSDFFVPEGTNISTIDANYFTFTGFRQGAIPAKGKRFAVNKAFSSAFTALTGLGVASAQLQFLPGGINTPHTHPRATEVLFLCAGSLEVGLIDTTNKLFTQTLQAGDVFVFPKGLVHFEVNPDSKVIAKAISSFSSSSPGLVSLPPTLFASGIDQGLLAQAFGVSGDVISKLEAGAAM